MFLCPDDRSRFLRFVTGRRRLPAPLYICPEKGEAELTVESVLTAKSIYTIYSAKVRGYESVDFTAL